MTLHCKSNYLQVNYTVFFFFFYWDKVSQQHSRPPSELLTIEDHTVNHSLSEHTPEENTFLSSAQRLKATESKSEGREREISHESSVKEKKATRKQMETLRS